MGKRKMHILVVISFLLCSMAAAGERNLSDELSRDMWFSTGTLRTKSAVMQSFDIDFEENLIYYTQLNNKFRVYVCWGEPNGTVPGGSMELLYSGHGSNFTLEKDGDNRFIWISNYASKNAKGEYWDSQIISRVPVVDGAVYNPWDCDDNYYFGDANIAAAVDTEGDRLVVLNIGSGRVRTYSLSRLRAHPTEEITLRPIVYGGDKAPQPETTEVFKVMARDCSAVDPLGDFTVHRDEGIAWQGFDICGDFFYQARGNGNQNDGLNASTGWILVYKTDGTPVLPPTPVQALNNLDTLNEWGITDTGYMEPEGVKIRRGAMYCGFANKNSQNIRRGTILKYSIPHETLRR